MIEINRCDEVSYLGTGDALITIFFIFISGVAIFELYKLYRNDRKRIADDIKSKELSEYKKRSLESHILDYMLEVRPRQ